MVSWETRMRASSGKRVLRPRAICRGDQLRLSRRLTQAHKPRAPCEQARLWPARTLPGTAIGSLRPVRAHTAIALDLAADGRSRPSQLAGDLIHGAARRQTAGDLLALRCLQRRSAPTPRFGCAPAVASDDLENDGRPAVQLAPDLGQALALPPALPQRRYFFDRKFFFAIQHLLEL